MTVNNRAEVARHELTRQAASGNKALFNDRFQDMYQKSSQHSRTSRSVSKRSNYVLIEMRCQSTPSPSMRNEAPVPPSPSLCHFCWTSNFVTS